MRPYLRIENRPPPLPPAHPPPGEGPPPNSTWDQFQPMGPPTSQGTPALHEVPGRRTQTGSRPNQPKPRTRNPRHTPGRTPGKHAGNSSGKKFRNLKERIPAAAPDLQRGKRGSRMNANGPKQSRRPPGQIARRDFSPANARNKFRTNFPGET